MKHLLSILFLFIVCLGFAQTKDSLSIEEQQRREKNIQAGNPFKKFGYTPKIHTLSKGKYLEFHDLDSIVKIGSFSYHVKNKTITSYTQHETKYSEATLKPEIVSRWFSPDPLSDEFPSWSPYNFTYNNPIRFVDPDGRSPLDVIIIFNKSTGKLAIIDKDHYQSGLPTKTVSAKDYVQGGIRDANGKLTHNQILVMENVFSGGKATNGVVERDPERSQQKPIPNGTFDLLDNDADTRHTGWFRLDKQDENRYNDKDDATGRDGFRFHLGTESWGCVTCDVSQGDRQEEWNVVTEILNSTSTTTVPEKRGNQKWNPFSWLTNYGTVNVIGEDKIPTKKEEK